MKRLADFLAHHNSVPIVLGLLFLASGTALAASPVARDALLGGVVTETVGVDNSAIIDADLGRFDSNMMITNVTEDAQSYYVAYRYQTFGVEGTAWKETSKDGVLTVAKSALQGGNLKAYVVEQLRQVAESDLAYLKRAQASEIASGRSESQVSASYRGLAGLAIEMKDILLPPASVASVMPRPSVGEQLPAPEVPVISDVSATPAATTTDTTIVPSETVPTASVSASEATTTEDAPTVLPATTTAVRIQESEATTTIATTTLPAATGAAATTSASQ